MKKYFIDFKEKDQWRQLYVLAKTEKEAVKIFKDWNTFIEWRNGMFTFQIVREEKVDCRKDRNIMKLYKKQKEYIEEGEKSYIRMKCLIKEMENANYKEKN